MSSHNHRKLNQLLRDWPPGTVATQAWLESRGIYRQLTRRYLLSGWIDRLGRGAFVRAGDTVDWLGAVSALQTQLSMHVRVTATTALLLRGLGHHLPLGDGEVAQLFSDRPERLPSWFVRHSWSVNVVHRCPRLFEGAEHVGFWTLDRGSFAVRASSPERAILEVLHLAADNAAIDHALDLLDGLTTLRPAVVQQLLESCRSVRIKRLFLWGTERAGHAWLDRVDRTAIDLGRGKRALYRGGQLDSRYQITVPRQETLPGV